MVLVSPFVLADGLNKQRLKLAWTYLKGLRRNNTNRVGLAESELSNSSRVIFFYRKDKQHQKTVGTHPEGKHSNRVEQAKS